MCWNAAKSGHLSVRPSLAPSESDSESGGAAAAAFLATFLGDRGTVEARKEEGSLSDTKSVAVQKWREGKRGSLLLPLILLLRGLSRGGAVPTGSLGSMHL